MLLLLPPATAEVYKYCHLHKVLISNSEKLALAAIVTTPIQKLPNCIDPSYRHGLVKRLNKVGARAILKNEEWGLIVNIAGHEVLLVLSRYNVMPAPNGSVLL